MSEDKRKNNGGARAGAGRPKKVDEAKAVERIKSALKHLYKKDEDEDNIKMLLVDFAQTTNGQKFFAEHLLGKAPDTVNLNTQSDGIDLSNVDTETLLKLRDSINENN